MLRVAIPALRSRRTQSVMLVLLAALVTAAAVATPFFVYASVERLSALDVAAAPAAQREVTVSHPISLQTDGAGALSDAIAAIPDVLRLPGFTGVTSVRIPSQVGPETGPAVGYLSFRDGVCDRVDVDGACPTAAGDAMITSATAAFAGVRLGSTLLVSSNAYPKPIPLHVVGVYTPRDQDDPYWGGSTLEAQLSQKITSGFHTTDAILVTQATIAATGATSAIVDRDLILTTGHLTVADSIADADAVFDAGSRLHGAGYTVSSDVRDLSNAIIIDTNQIFIGVPIGALEIVIFGWFALFFAVRATAQARRFDVGILKLRGVQRRNLWKLMAEQSALPLAAGVPIGLVLGFLGARLVAGPVTSSGDRTIAIALAAAGALVAVLGGLGVALLAERSALATPVGELLRSTPARRRAWKADVVDLILVLVAIAGVIQLHTTDAAAAGGSTLSALAPALIAFAAGLIAARLLAPLAKRAVIVARRNGRSQALLATTYLARRPGLDRLFALLAIAVALCGYSIMAGTTAAEARTARATLETGAPRVVTVAPVAPIRLLAAVRAADPTGRYAMAATEIDTGTSILAVDSARLAAVMPSGPAGGRTPAALAAMIRPEPAHNVLITTSSIDLTVNALALSPEGRPAYVDVLMIAANGYAFASFGPLTAGSQTYTAPAPDCFAASPCEMLGFQLTAAAPTDDPLSAPAPVGTDVVITDLDGVLGTSDLAALPWRTSVQPARIGPTIRKSANGLRLSIPDTTYARTLTFDPTAYLPSTPAVAPAVLAGPVPPLTAVGFPSVRPFGFASIFVRIAGTAPLLPRLENSGLLVDLDYVQTLAGADNGVQTSEVWLAADAPPGIIAALTKQGLVPKGTESIEAGIHAYADEPAVVGLRFQEFAGVVALAIAACVLLLVASVECRPRARELVALRRQGVSARVARNTSFLVYGVITGGAFVAGTAAAIADRLLADVPPLFRDGWHTLPPPSSLPPSAIAITLGITAATLALAAFGAAMQVVRAARAETLGGAR